MTMAVALGPTNHAAYVPPFVGHDSALVSLSGEPTKRPAET